jgi:hypothetical protein
MTRHYYKPGGPAFFLFSGEGELSDGYLQTGKCGAANLCVLQACNVLAAYSRRACAGRYDDQCETAQCHGVHLGAPVLRTECYCCVSIVLFVWKIHQFIKNQMYLYRNAERVENMRWLSAKQALADAAFFMNYAHVQHFYLQEKPKWIVFGGSYSGGREI